MVKKDSKIGLKKTFTEPEQHPLLEESSKSSKLPFSLQQLIPHYFWRINTLRVQNGTANQQPFQILDGVALRNCCLALWGVGVSILWAFGCIVSRSASVWPSPSCLKF